MQNVTVLAVGKLKEKYLMEGCAEYAKRLSSFCRLHIEEIAECRLPENPSAAQIALALKKEGDLLLARAGRADVLTALCIEGEMMTSQQFSVVLSGAALESKNNICLVIGGSYGLSDGVKSAAHLRLSLSRMTFPHQLARMLLMEQLYRAFSIGRGGKYHK